MKNQTAIQKKKKIPTGKNKEKETKLKLVV